MSPNANQPVIKRKIRYKLTSDEKEEIARAEREKRRKIRLLQVREISRKNAANIRNAVRLEKLRQIQKLADNINNEFDKSKKQQLEELEDNYENSLRNIGRAHINASTQMEDENKKCRLKKENRLKAIYRHNAALERLHDNQVRNYVHKNKHIIARKAVLEREKERASQIAALPKPSPGILEDLQHKDVKYVNVRNENLNHDEIYFPMSNMVKRHHNESVEDGRRAAMIQEEKLDEQIIYAKSLAVEREQVAQIRFKKAIDKELLDRDSEKVMKELSFLQKKQTKQRQKQLVTIPKQVFLPPYKREENLKDKQRVMEEEFEQFYVGDEMALKSDLSVLLEPHPPVEMPSQTDSLDLTVASDPECSPLRNQSTVMKDITNVSVQPNQNITTKRQTLQCLFDRIKTQRDEWISDMAENLHETEVDKGRNQTIEASVVSPVEISMELENSKSDSQLFDSLTEVKSSFEMKENMDPVNKRSPARKPVANVVERMEKIQKQLQQIPTSEEEEERQQQEESQDEEEEREVSVETKDVSNQENPPTECEFNLQKQIQEVLEQKKRILEQKKQLEERLQQFDCHQLKTLRGGYIFNPLGKSKSPRNVRSNDDCTQQISNEAEDDFKGNSKNVPDSHVTKLPLKMPSLPKFHSQIDLPSQLVDPQSPDDLSPSALKSRPNDVTKVQQYQQSIIQQRSERLKRIEEIQTDIEKHRKSLQNSISGIDLMPFGKTGLNQESALNSTEHNKNIQDILLFPRKETNSILTNFQPGISQTLFSGNGLDHLSEINLPQDQILDSGLGQSDGFFPKDSDYQLSIQGSIVGSDLGRNFKDIISDKQSDTLSCLESGFLPFLQKNFPVNTKKSSAPKTPELNSKTNDFSFTPSFDLDSISVEPIPSSELQEIRKSLPFDETLEDSTQPTPDLSHTVSPHKNSFPDHNGYALIRCENSDDFGQEGSMTLPSNDLLTNQQELLRIQKQLEEIKKQRENLDSLKEKPFENETKLLESLRQENLISQPDLTHLQPLVSELTKPSKKHPPLLPMASLYGHSPHQLSVIQEKDGSFLSSRPSDMHSKLSLSSSICSPTETAGLTRSNPLISEGRLLEEKKLWNILKILDQENLNKISDGIEQNLNQSKEDESFQPSSEAKDVSTSFQTSPSITLSKGTLNSPLSTDEKPIACKKTWAEILLEKSQQTSESDAEISLLQNIPKGNQTAFPKCTSSDLKAVSSLDNDPTRTPLVDSNTINQDANKIFVIQPSSSLRSLDCEPKSGETSSNESKLVSYANRRDSSSSTHGHDISDGLSIATNSEYPSTTSFSKDLLRNHKEISEFLSRFVQTYQKFDFEALRQSSENKVETLQSSAGISPFFDSSKTVVDQSSAFGNQPNSDFTFNSSLQNTEQADLISSLFQLTATSNQSILANGPTLGIWSPNFDNTINNPCFSQDSKTNSSNASLISVIPQTIDNQGIAPNSVINFCNQETKSSIAKDVGSQGMVVSSTIDNSHWKMAPSLSTDITKEDVVATSVVATANQRMESSSLMVNAGNQGLVTYSTIDVGNDGMITTNTSEPLKSSSQEQITISLSTLPSYQSSHQTNVTIPPSITKMADGFSDLRFSSVSYPLKQFPSSSSSSKAVGDTLAPQKQTQNEIKTTPSPNQAFILPSSTPILKNLLPVSSKPFPLTHPSSISPISYGTTNLNSSPSDAMISSCNQTSTASILSLTQCSIQTNSGSDDNVTSSSINSDKTKKMLTIPVSQPSFSSYSRPVFNRTPQTVTLEALVGMESSNRTENLLPSNATLNAAFSSFASSALPPLLDNRLSTTSPLALPRNTLCGNEIKTNKMSTSPPGIPSTNSSAKKELDIQSQIQETLQQVESKPFFPVIQEQFNNDKSTPVSSSSSSENLSLTQYSYTSPETENEENLIPQDQTDYLNTSAPLSLNSYKNTIDTKTVATTTEFVNPSLKKDVNSGPNCESQAWMSLSQKSLLAPSSSESETFKCARFFSAASDSSQSAEENSPSVKLETREKSSNDESSFKTESPPFLPLMHDKNQSLSASSDVSSEKASSIRQAFITPSTEEATSLRVRISTPPELSDSHCSSKMHSSAELSGLSGLSQLSLPSDMMEDYQHLIQQARTLVKRCKANLDEEKENVELTAEETHQVDAALNSDQVLSSEAEAVQKRNLFKSQDTKLTESTGRGEGGGEEGREGGGEEGRGGGGEEGRGGGGEGGGGEGGGEEGRGGVGEEGRGGGGGEEGRVGGANEMTQQNFILQFTESIEKGILEEADLSLVPSNFDSQFLMTESQRDTGSTNETPARNLDNYSIENKEMALTCERSSNSVSESETKPEDLISNSLAAWKLKYSLGSQLKK